MQELLEQLRRNEVPQLLARWIAHLEVFGEVVELRLKDWVHEDFLHDETSSLRTRMTRFSLAGQSRVAKQ